MTISLTISTQRIRESRTNAESIQRISSSITARDDDLLTALYSPLALNMCLLSISLTWRHTKNPIELTQRSMPQKCKHLSKQRRKRRKQRKSFHKTWIQVCSDFQSAGLPLYVCYIYICLQMNANRSTHHLLRCLMLRCRLATEYLPESFTPESDTYYIEWHATLHQ